MKKSVCLSLLWAVPALAFAGCAVDAGSGEEPIETTEQSTEYECKLDPLSLTVKDASKTSLTVEVCAGASGAEGGLDAWRCGG